MVSNDGVVSEEINRVSPVVSTYGREVASIVAVGAAVGLIVSGAYYLLEKYIFSAVLCRAGADASCSQAPEYAMVVAMVIGAIVGLLALVQVRVYRPLLVVIGSLVTLWGFTNLVSDLTWYWSLLASVVFFALTYLLYAWVARIRSFLLASIIAIILFVATRYVVLS
ncbi:MAG TPA: hypothetical protein VL362_02175 [Patescibacteria group bacterium]|jgi:hypothetical protein|nr:hypothetical protein [Patescibacteria group bacterium]